MQNQASLQETKQHGAVRFPFNLYPCTIPGDFPQVALHWQESMELVFVKRGTGLVQVGAESCPARMGDIFIFTPGTLHALRQAEGRCMEYENIIFELELLGGAEDLCAEKYLLPLQSGRLSLPARLTPNDLCYLQAAACLREVEDANRAIEANKAQQIQIAKRLLLMQLSDFSKITTDTDGSESVGEWDRSMAVALSHCSRVALTMPKVGEYAGNADEQQAMWRSIMTINGENTAQDNSRASSTHSIERRRVVPGEGATVRKSKEKKVLFNFIGQRGMNCAIGGLGNPGVSGKTILNNGSCGHFYSMYKEGDEEHYGAMLMGMESDAHGVMNQMGHTHDIHATPEKASSFGGQRTDEVGNKYGGRQCDLSKKSAREITRWMTALERKMQEWQSQPDGMSGAEAEEAMRLLAGESLHVWNWTRMSELLGMDA